MRSFIGFMLFLLVGFSLGIDPGAAQTSKQSQPTSVAQLEQKLKTQYAKIEQTIANPPSPADSRVVVRLPGQPPYDVAAHRRRIREWQDDLAQSFKAAADTVAEILKLNPPNADFWNERLETLLLYAEPVRSPDDRTVFGAGEMQKTARLLEMPLANYTAEAQTAKAKGDVRLRLVLAADGTVKNVFPLKSLPHGLTESAMTAARQIKFEPGVRNGQPASQFLTVVYEFEKGHARKPYIPRSEF